MCPILHTAVVHYTVFNSLNSTPSGLPTYVDVHPCYHNFLLEY